MPLPAARLYSVPTSTIGADGNAPMRSPMAYRRIIGTMTVTDLENVDAQLVRAAHDCLGPLIEYLRQTARTAADAQALRNALDALAAIRAAQAKLMSHHPNRRAS